MNILPLVIQIAALICLLAASFGLWPSKVQWGWFGLALWLCSLMVSGVVIHQAS